VKRPASSFTVASKAVLSAQALRGISSSAQHVWTFAHHIETEHRMENENVRIVLLAFDAVEQQDDLQFFALIDPEFKIYWPPSLPYGGETGRPDPSRPSWSEIWVPLQPTEAERKMDPRVIAGNEDEVVVHWRQRGVTPGGDRFDSEVLGLYRVHNGKLAQAKMFYFDTAAVAAFLKKANADRNRR
jgi:ketosteroid isomerase-like protein